jgi:ATP-dependent RNA helicase RhlE
VNFDLPDDPENYVHRIGRTGRAGSKGHAISFAMPDQGKDVRNIEKIIKSTIILSRHPSLPHEKFSDSGNKPFPYSKKHHAGPSGGSHRKKRHWWKKNSHR